MTTFLALEEKETSADGTATSRIGAQHKLLSLTLLAVYSGDGLIIRPL